MAKAAQEKTSPVFWVLLVTLAVAAYILTEPQAAAQRTARERPKTTASTSKDGFTPADYQAKFPRLTGEVRNVFRPLVARKDATGGDAVPNGIPASLAGGDGRWIYTGMATVDGMPTGLVENTATGESLFLSAGETWKSASVVQIRPDALVLRDATGTTFNIPIFTTESDATEVPAGSVAPVQPSPPLRGPIGGTLSIEPMGGSVR